ncbi:unnamed protein product [Boreogadus saida]
MAPPTVKQRILIGLMSDPWLRCTSCLGRCLSRCTRFPGHSFIDGARLEARETREWRARGSRDVVPALPGLLSRARSSRAIHSFTGHAGDAGVPWPSNQQIASALPS